MELCGHALYYGHVYAEPEGATFTYAQMVDVKSYLHKLLHNNHLKALIIKHFSKLDKFLSHPACEVIHQLNFNLDLIEVSNGYCLSIKNHRFIPCPLEETICGKISPRAFVSYDHTNIPAPGYFRDGSENWFDDPTPQVLPVSTEMVQWMLQKLCKLVARRVLNNSPYYITTNLLPVLTRTKTFTAEPKSSKQHHCNQQWPALIIGFMTMRCTVLCG